MKANKNQSETTYAKSGKRKPFTGPWAAVETLECRALLTSFVSGIPAWDSVGPTTIVQGGSNIPNQLNPVAGRVQAVATVPADPNTLYIATANSGVWVTHDAQQIGGHIPITPFWTPLTQREPWVSVGSLAVSPLTPGGQTVFAGLGDVSSFANEGTPYFGVIKTTDGGATWTRSGVDIFNNLTITSILPTSVMERNPDTTKIGQVVLAAADNGNGGIFRSDDGGATWKQISGSTANGNNLPLGAIQDVVGDASNAHTFYAAVPTKGVFRSIDAGLSWFPVKGLPASVISASTRMVMASGGPTGNGLFVAMFNDNYGAIYNNGQNPGILKTRLQVFRSADHGKSWTQMDSPSTLAQPFGLPNAPPPAETQISTDAAHLTADPKNANIVYIGGGGEPPDTHDGGSFTYGSIYRGDASKPRGSQWNPVVGSNANGTEPHADMHDMAIEADGNLLETDDGGIVRLTSPGDPSKRAWQSLIGDLSATEMFSGAWDSVNGVGLGGAQDNGNFEIGTIADNGGHFQAWHEVIGGDGGWVATDDISDPGHSIHYQSRDSLQSFQRQTFDNHDNASPAVAIQLIVNGTGGKTVAQVNKGDSNGLRYVQPFYLNSQNPKRMVVADHELFESFDQGDHFNELGTLGLGRSKIGAIAYGGRIGNVSYPDVLFAGRDAIGGVPAQVYRRESGTGLLKLVPNYPGANPIDIELNPNNWREAFVLDSNGQVYELRTNSNDSTTWTNLTGNLNHVGDPTGTATAAFGTMTVYQSGFNLVLLVGGLGGVYRSINPDNRPIGSAPTWQTFGNFLPGSIVTQLTQTPDRQLVAATLGSGLYLMPNFTQYVTQPAILTVNGDLDHANENDHFVIAQDASNPLLTDITITDETPGTGTYSVNTSSLNQIVINPGGGNNTIDFHSLPTVNTFGGLSTFLKVAGNDTINVGSAGSTQGILSDLYINASKSTAVATLKVDDSTDPESRVIDVNGGSIDIGPISIFYPGSLIHALTIKTGTGGNTVKILGTSLPLLTANSLIRGTTNIITAGGQNIVDVGTDGTHVGNLSLVTSPVSVSGPAVSKTNSITLNISDSGDTTARRAVVLNQEVDVGLAHVLYVGSSVEALNLVTGLGNDNVSVQSTGLAVLPSNIPFLRPRGVTSLSSAGGTDSITVGLGNSLNGIQSTLDVDNPNGLSNLTFNNSADPNTGTETITPFTPFGDTPWNDIGGLAPADIRYEIGDVRIPAASISGTVFNDASNDGIRQPDEVGLARVQVYLDVNKNGKPDNGEPTTQTTSTGTYAFSNVVIGQYIVRAVAGSPYKQSLPAGGASHQITVVTPVAGADFGFHDGSAPAYVQTVQTTPGLVAYWRFDASNPFGSSVGGFTGTAHGGAALTAAGSGAPIDDSTGRGLSLTGGRAFLSTSLAAQQTFDNAGTLMAWVNFANTPAKTGRVMSILSKGQFGNDLDLQAEPDGKIHFYTDSGTSSSFTPSSLTGWHFVVATFDEASQQRRIYWDGALVANDLFTRDHQPSTAALMIGESAAFPGRFFDGTIDEVSLYNRALSQSEVQMIFAAATH